MGGWGSGRTSYRSLVERALILDLPLLMRRGWVRDGLTGTGKLRLRTGDGRHVPIILTYDLTYAYDGWLQLRYRHPVCPTPHLERKQRIRMEVTEPHFGGRRWWMICSYSGKRVAKLYLPPGGDTFAAREQWDLSYRSQRADEREKAFQRLFRLQRKLGCAEHWGAEPTRPKGMWHKTFNAKFAEYRELDAQCAAMTQLLLDEVRNLYS